MCVGERIYPPSLPRISICFRTSLPTVSGEICGSTGAYTGVYGYAYELGGMGVGHFIGVYGRRTGGATGYGVYYSGGMSGTSKAGLIVRTDNGPKEVCFHQATESWLEDFGSGEIRGGRAEVQLH